jgi:hypothetical protein
MKELTVVVPGKLRWLEKASPSIEGPLQDLQIGALHVPIGLLPILPDVVGTSNHS